MDQENKTKKDRRGFASMDPEKQRQIARKGGQAAHASGNAHEWTSEEAKNAGRKGGQTSGQRRKAMAMRNSGQEEEQEEEI